LFSEARRESVAWALVFFAYAKRFSLDHRLHFTAGPEPGVEILDDNSLDGHEGIQGLA
jgi:hypothetical protein